MCQGNFLLCKKSLVKSTTGKPFVSFQWQESCFESSKKRKFFLKVGPIEVWITQCGRTEQDWTCLIFLPKISGFFGRFLAKIIEMCATFFFWNLQIYFRYLFNIVTIYVEGYCRNQVFPEIPRHFWKCLGNCGNCGIA